MSEIYQLPENNSGNNATIPFSIPIGFGGMCNNGFGFGNGGFNSIADLFGLAIIASMFGWGNGGFGGGFENVSNIHKQIYLTKRILFNGNT